MRETGSFFRPHRSLADEVNRNIVRSEIEGGVYLKDLPPDTTLEIETQNRWYIIILKAHGEAIIHGHPQYCPDPVKVRITGSNWGGSMVKQSYVGRGMHLEFCHPDYNGPIITSPIVDIRMR